MHLYSVLCVLFIQLCIVSVCFGLLNIITCFFTECCTDYEIPANFNGLKHALKRRVYGQHLAQQIVFDALRAHWDGSHQPEKALTLSFHGWAGTGKNFITKLVTHYMFRRGSKSKFVHHFIGRIHFTSVDKVVHYQEDLKRWIRGNVSRCSKQLFIFDEVDKMPAEILDGLKPLIDYFDDIDNVDYRSAIFIFLSNTGAHAINERYLELWQTGGKKREDLELKNFENAVMQGAYNEEGGFHYSDTIKNNLIDHYVPFLPMELRHVKMCVIDEFRARNVMRPTEEHIREAMDFIVWGPPTIEIFSGTGCKRISQKVGAIVSKYNLRKDDLD